MMYKCLRKSVNNMVFAKVSQEVTKYRYLVNG